jgi:hypothetical protein
MAWNVEPNGRRSADAKKAEQRNPVELPAEHFPEPALLAAAR